MECVVVQNNTEKTFVPMPFPDERSDDFGRRSFLLLFVNLLSENLGTIRQNVELIFSLFCVGFLKE